MSSMIYSDIGADNYFDIILTYVNRESRIGTIFFF